MAVSAPVVLLRSSRLWALALLLLTAALLGWWLWPGSADTSPAGSLGGPAAMQRGGPGSPWSGPVPVRLAEVRRGSFDVELKALGTVTALNTVSVRPQVGGQLVKVLFEEGQEVKAGQLLAQIDPRPYQVAVDQARADLAQGRAQLSNAEQDLARYRQLLDEDSIALQTLDTQQAQVAQYRAQLAGQQAALAKAQLDLDYSSLRAPLAGRLGLRQLDVGNLVSANDSNALVVITQVQPIEVSFTLAEQALPAVLEQVRSGAQLQVEAWDRDERQLLASGELRSLDNQIDPATGTLRLKARFANSDERLLPNQFVNVRVRVARHEEALLIPSASLQYGNSGSFVFVVDGQLKVQQRPVTIAASNGPDSLVGEGLELGERVVLEGIDQLKDGGSVRVIGDRGESPEPPAGDGESGAQRSR